MSNNSSENPIRDQFLFGKHPTSLKKTFFFTSKIIIHSQHKMEPKNCLPFVIETLSKMELMVKMLHSVVNELYQREACTPNSGATIDDCRSQIKNMDQSIALEFLKYALDSFADNSDLSLGNNSSANITTNNILVTVPGCTDGPTANTNLSLIPLAREYWLFHDNYTFS